MIKILRHLTIAVVLISPFDYADATVINFDSLDASSSPVTGAALDSYLAGFGVSISDVTAGLTIKVDDDRAIYGGGYVAATSPHNVLLSYGPASADTFTLDFGTSLASFGFSRSAYIGPGIVPQWSATAFDSLDGMGTVLNSVGESLDVAPLAGQDFLLQGAGTIRSVVFNSNAFNIAGYTSPPLDNFVLISATVPEPATFSIVGFGLAGLAWSRKKSK